MDLCATNKKTLTCQVFRAESECEVRSPRISKSAVLHPGTVHYEGRLFDGTVFDSSLKRGEPATFPVGGVIAGWTEALQLMPVGSKWQLFIPADLAYGENGAGNVIQPNSALVFDVELLAIQDDAPAAE